MILDEPSAGGWIQCQGERESGRVCRPDVVSGNEETAQ